MTNIKRTLDLLETHLQTLIEKRVSRLFTPNTTLNSLDLSHRVVDAIQQCMSLEQSFNLAAPEIITIQAHPLQATEIWNDIDLVSELKLAIQKAVQQAGLQFDHPPELLVEGDEKLAPNELEVQAAYRTSAVAQTQMVAAVTDESDEQPATENAFLIYSNNQVQSLEDHMFTIGSGAENDLQLEDSLVEKQHAQLRLIGDHYVIFDLDTRHGTLVNQQKIRQHTLRPGDVLIFGSTRIIYGENHNRPVDQTQEYIPPSNGFIDGMDESR